MHMTIMKFLTGLARSVDVFIYKKKTDTEMISLSL
jgi:hypothetical protein